MITVLTGLTDEAAILANTPGVKVLCGSADRDNLAKRLAPKTTALVSFGVCGALSPKLKVADLVFGTFVTDGSATRHKADQDWFETMAGRLTFPHHGAPVYSTGAEGADTPEERRRLFSESRVWTIDDESFAVAQVATTLGLPFAIVRSVSDDCHDTVPSATKNATNPDGTSNIDAVLDALRKDPSQVFNLVQISFNFEQALGTLRGAWRNLRPQGAGGRATPPFLFGA
jgi:adenosylhomocysteine nucleosidase